MKNVLVAPLDWGMGHATRCIPIINLLIQQQHNVIIASNSSALKLLKIEFPGLTFEELPEYNPSYPKNSSFHFKMATQSPKILFTIFREQKTLKSIIRKHKLDLIISDSRFGIYSTEVPSIFISHQLHIKLSKGISFLEKPLNLVNHYFIKKHKECWVPDFSGSLNFSGTLSSNGIANKKHIGPLSRFTKCENTIDYDLIIILSGQEPQRSTFEEKIIDQLREIDKKVFLVRGSFRCDLDPIEIDNVEVAKFLNAEDLNEKICSSKLVLSRSGYSSIMDYIQLGKDAVLIPTPGQTEQEYLATYLKEKGYFYSESEREFNLKKCIKESLHYDLPDLSNESVDLVLELNRVLELYVN